MDTTMKNRCTTKNNFIKLPYDILTILSVADCKIKVKFIHVVTSKAILAGSAFFSIQYKLKFKIITKMDGVNAWEAKYINERSIANGSQRFKNI